MHNECIRLGTETHTNKKRDYVLKECISQDIKKKYAFKKEMSDITNNYLTQRPKAF